MVFVSQSSVEHPDKDPRETALIGCHMGGEAQEGDGSWGRGLRTQALTTGEDRLLTEARAGLGLAPSSPVCAPFPGGMAGTEV